MFGFLENLTNGSLGFSNPFRNQFWALNADEVGLRLVGDGFRKKRFTGTGRTEQDDTSGRFDTEVFEQFWFGEWPFNRFLEAVLHLVQSTDFFPRYFRDFDVNFSQSRGFDVTNRFFEVVHADLHLLQNFGR